MNATYITRYPGYETTAGLPEARALIETARPATTFILMLLGAPLVGLAFVIAAPLVGLALAAWIAIRTAKAVAPVVTRVALFIAAPFVALVYVIAMPFVGLGMLLYYGVRAVRN